MRPPLAESGPGNEEDVSGADPGKDLFAPSLESPQEPRHVVTTR